MVLELNILKETQFDKAFIAWIQRQLQLALTEEPDEIPNEKETVIPLIQSQNETLHNQFYLLNFSFTVGLK